jgi:hypothetical protein
MPVPVVLVGASDVILYANPSAETLFTGQAMQGLAWRGVLFSGGTRKVRWTRPCRPYRPSSRACLWN